MEREVAIGETRQRKLRGSRDEELSYVRVAARLRSLILSGEYAPGDWLRMQSVAKRFGVSVQPVREALQHLQGDGLVEFLPNRGARVRGLDRGRIVHIFEIREAIESFMARRFAEECSLRDIVALEKIQAEHDRAVETRELMEVGLVNKRFHAIINGHGGNTEALSLVTRYYALTGSLRMRSKIDDGYWDRARAEHHALIKAFRERDVATAGEIGARHVRDRRNEMLEDLDRQFAAAST
jgi:DNA-binding GntR family transcriptional regulator